MKNMDQTKILQNLETLLLIDSKSSNIQGVNELGNAIQEMLKDLPLEWQRIKKEGAADFLISETKVMDNTKPVIVLSAHMDVIYSANEVEFKEVGDKIYGSGAQDMKSSIIVIIELLKKLHKENKLENIILSLSPQEELATPNYRETVKEIARRADYVLVFESTLDIDPNAELKKRSIVTSRRGFEQFILKINGKGGHSGVLINKKDRKTVVHPMAEFILGLENLVDYDKETTANVGLINGGQAVNVLMPNIEILFEVRFRYLAEHTRIKACIHKQLENIIREGFEVNLEEKGFFPPLFESNVNKNFIDQLMAIAMSKGIDLIIEKRTGGSESSLFQDANPKAVVLDGFGPRGEHQHTKEEFVYSESIFSAIEFDYEVLKKVLEKK